MAKDAEVMEVARLILDYLQALIWPVLLLAFVVWRRRDIAGILTDVKKRVHSGDPVEVGGVKLGSKSLDEDKLYEKLASAVETALKSVVSADQLQDAVKTVEKQIKQEAFLTVDATPLFGPAVEPWTVPYNRFESVSALLNDIWATIRRHGCDLPNLSFGSVWVLRVDGRCLTDQEVGIRWAHRHQKKLDDRPLNSPDVGIEPGMRLSIVPAGA